MIGYKFFELWGHKVAKFFDFYFVQKNLAARGIRTRDFFEKKLFDPFPTNNHKRDLYDFFDRTSSDYNTWSLFEFLRGGRASC